jgi:ribose transport system permease protein
MKKVLGVLGLLLFVVIYTWLNNSDFRKAYNIYNILQRAALYGVLGIGVSFVIISGGIDLSTGSVIGLVGCMVPLLIQKRHWSGESAIAAALLVTAVIGLAHGLLITKLRLQPFVVTLCGMLIYRSLARYIAGDATLGMGEGYEDWSEWLATGRKAVPWVLDSEGRPYEIPTPFFILLGLAVLAAVYLNWTVAGRYLLAVGRNEQAARFSGINTDRVVILSYVLCGLIGGGLGGIMFLFYQESIQPDNHGNFYEVYAIAAAVLGGCSLRGGEGSILGVVLGAALIQVLYNASNLLKISTTLEFATIGSVILAGAIVDEMVKRLAAARRRYKEGR